MTPQDVENMQFERVKRGFDPQAVGAFLERTGAALAARDRELHEAQTEIAALSRAVADSRQHEEAFRLTMTAATEAKEEMLRRAKEEAARIEQEARDGAELVRERARIGAEGQVASAKHEIASLRAEKEKLELEVADLRAAAQTVHNSLDAMGLEALGVGQEAVGRPPLELVVDQQKPVAPSGNEGLAARVGDLRG